MILRQQSSPALRAVCLPGSGAFSLVVVLETNHTRAGRFSAAEAMEKRS
jgi:hypothetical protein